VGPFALFVEVLMLYRQLGAAFLSPDYDEVRALLNRYGQQEQPVSASTQMRFHVHYPTGQEPDAGAGGRFEVPIVDLSHHIIADLERPG
jgi:hypothetical protein